MKIVHLLFSKLGTSMGGHRACIKHGCKTYCGYSPSECMMFIEHKGRKS